MLVFIFTFPPLDQFDVRDEVVVVDVDLVEERSPDGVRCLLGHGSVGGGVGHPPFPSYPIPHPMQVYFDRLPVYIVLA